MARPLQVSTSTVKKSIPASTSMCAAMKSFQVVVWLRLAPVQCRVGAGCCPQSDRKQRGPGSPMLRRCGHNPSQFSFAICTIRSVTSRLIRGRPGKERNFEPSNFLAMSRRYQARIVSGFATQATSFSALRPSRLPISASVDRSGSDRRNRDDR